MHRYQNRLAVADQLPQACDRLIAQSICHQSICSFEVTRFGRLIAQVRFDRRQIVVDHHVGQGMPRTAKRLGNVHVCRLSTSAWREESAFWLGSTM